MYGLVQLSGVRLIKGLRQWGVGFKLVVVWGLGLKDEHVRAVGLA